MCGIVGYVGDDSVSTVLLAALSRLEYRGYDSAGLAALNGNGIHIVRRKGKLKELKAAVLEHPVPGHVGIGHTRWATHGEPSERNAHPHFDKERKIAVVHNGIIENHEDLKAELSAEGYVFESETDTEVLAHLMSKYHIKEGRSLVESVQLTIGRIEGTYAFAVLSTKDPDTFIAARSGSPLVVGLGEHQNFIASDAPALIDYTRRVIFLEDGQIAVVKKEGVQVMTTDGKPVDVKVTEVDWEAKDVSKEGFDHFMLKEIEEQPKVLEKLIKNRISSGSKIKIFDTLNFDESVLQNASRVIIQACGTSWHAALTGKYLLETLAGIPTEVDVSSEFRYRKLVRQENAIVLSITQSGETVDTLMGLRQAKQMGYKTIAVCNVLGSTIARESDGVIYTHAGPEIGVASTKAYTAQLGVLYALALYWGQIRKTLDSAEYDELVQELKQIPAKMKAIIAKKDVIRKVAGIYYESRDFLFLGRGVNYPNAHEGALKIKEIAYIHATGHAAGEMKHGPIALIDEKMPVVCIANKSAVHEKMASNIQEVKARHGKVIAIVSDGDVRLEKFVDNFIEIPECHEYVSPLLVCLPLQYLAYYVAVLRGTDVDQPRNLAKSVTVE